MSWAVRRDYLVKPFFRGLGWYMASYVVTTALLRPWGVGAAWSVVVPLGAGIVLAAWLWRPWGILAPNSKGSDGRLGPLLVTVLVCVGAGYCLRQLLHARLGEVRDLRSVRELAQPGEAVFFRLHGPFYIDKAHRGEYTNISKTKNKGTITCYAHCYYACPLLATPSDTTAPAPSVAAWLGYADGEELGRNIPSGEQRWRSLNFFARCQARYDTLDLRRFTYLKREESPDASLFTAVWRSRLSPGSPYEPLLLTPVAEDFTWRGLPWLGRALALVLGGSVVVAIMLLATALRPLGEWPY